MMNYPAIEQATCSETVISFLKLSPDEFEAGKQYNNPSNLDDELKNSVDEAAERLFELEQTVLSENKQIRGEFDSRACSILHGDLSIDISVASDSGFWRWLAFYDDGIFAGIVRARYGPATQAKHFGVGGSLDDCYLMALWFRANAVYADNSSFDNGYDLAAYGGVDFWRSHVLRQDYGQSVEFVRALVRISKDKNLPTGSTSDPKAKLGIRDLAPELKKRAVNYALELMTEDEAYEFLEFTLATSNEWCGKPLD
jgi:hypothetical protein